MLRKLFQNFSPLYQNRDKFHFKDEKSLRQVTDNHKKSNKTQKTSLSATKKEQKFSYPTHYRKEKSIIKIYVHTFKVAQSEVLGDHIMVFQGVLKFLLLKYCENFYRSFSVGVGSFD